MPINSYAKVANNVWNLTVENLGQNLESQGNTVYVQWWAPQLALFCNLIGVLDSVSESRRLRVFAISL